MAANVSVWDARPLNTFVHPVALRTALAAAACTSGRVTQNVGKRTDIIPLVQTLSTIPLAPGPTDPFDYRSLHSVTIYNG